MLRYEIIGTLSLLLACTSTHSKKQPFELSKENAFVMVSGTAPMHDWKMYLKTFDCNADFIMKDSEVKGIDEVTFSCKATDLKSDDPLMDNKAYSALNSGNFPEIKFNMTSPIKLSPDNNKFRDKLNGDLYLAGKSIAVSIPLNGTLDNKNGAAIIDVSGETELKMSDFDITPPSFLMGMLKTGDKVTVSFSLQFSQKPEQ
jgi:polyisoprenoid-binding protein YceI